MAENQSERRASPDQQAAVGQRLSAAVERRADERRAVERRLVERRITPRRVEDHQQAMSGLLWVWLLSPVRLWEEWLRLMTRSWNPQRWH